MESMIAENIKAIILANSIPASTKSEKARNPDTNACYLTS